MQTGPFNTESLEQIARDVGRRWGSELKAHYLATGRAIASWPGTLGEARQLVDAAVGRQLDDQERELLALLVERGARRAWHSRDHIAEIDRQPNVQVEVATLAPVSPSRSGVMLKPIGLVEPDDSTDAPRQVASLKT
jgi:hypothetical protein